MSRLLAHLAGNELAGFILVLARVTPLFIVAPLFSSPMLPPRVRGVIAVALSIGLAPIALRGQQIPTDPIAIAGLVVEGLLVGLAFAFSIAVLLGAIQSAGALLDVASGFSYGQLVDPFLGQQGAVLGQLYTLFGTMIFLTIGGDAWMVRGISQTFSLVPLTSAPHIASMLGGVEQVFGAIFTATLEIAAPVLIALLMTDAAFGVVSRVVPQLNVFAVGFPVKVIVTLIIVAATLPFVSSWVAGQLSNTVGNALLALRFG